MAEGQCSLCGKTQVIGGNCPNCGIKIEVWPCLKSMIHKNGASAGMIHVVSSKKQSTNKNGIFSGDMTKKRIINEVSQ